MARCHAGGAALARSRALDGFYSLDFAGTYGEDQAFRELLAPGRPFAFTRLGLGRFVSKPTREALRQRFGDAAVG